MSDDKTCMTVLGGRATGHICGRPAVARRGARCALGCNGEGDFEYWCEAHMYVARYAKGKCVSCGSDMQLFEPQPLAAVVSGRS